MQDSSNANTGEAFLGASQAVRRSEYESSRRSEHDISRRNDKNSIATCKAELLLEKGGHKRNTARSEQATALRRRQNLRWPIGCQFRPPSPAQGIRLRRPPSHQLEDFGGGHPPGGPVDLESPTQVVPGSAAKADNIMLKPVFGWKETHLESSRAAY